MYWLFAVRFLFLVLSVISSVSLAAKFHWKEEIHIGALWLTSVLITSFVASMGWLN